MNMNYTETAITYTFWQLLDEKPYNKITVKDIVERCQINRNTFYYHFHDIPDLLERSIKKDADYIIQNYSKFGSPADCLLPIVQYSTKRKKAVLHIYRSLQREIFLNELERIAFYFVTQYIDTVTVDYEIPSDDKKLFIRFYKCMLVGIILDWLNDGMSYDLMESFIRIYSLFENPGKQALLKCAKPK